MPTAMIALGGNSISQKGEAGDISLQFTNTRQALDGISHFISRNYNLCINHGNGPQVGNELYRMELTQNKIPSLPLGVCVAATQGTIGYMIQQSMQNKLRNMNIDREVEPLISQVLVNANDPKIKNPQKFIGPRYTKKKAEDLVLSGLTSLSKRPKVLDWGDIPQNLDIVINTTSVGLVKDESIKDTLVDMANYALIALILYEEENNEDN